MCLDEKACRQFASNNAEMNSEFDKLEDLKCSRNPRGTPATILASAQSLLGRPRHQCTQNGGIRMTVAMQEAYSQESLARSATITDFILERFGSPTSSLCRRAGENISLRNSFLGVTSFMSATGERYDNRCTSMDAVVTVTTATTAMRVYEWRCE